jgi:hypothetical protein
MNLIFFPYLQQRTTVHLHSYLQHVFSDDFILDTFICLKK